MLLTTENVNMLNKGQYFVKNLSSLPMQVII